MFALEKRTVVVTVIGSSAMAITCPRCGSQFDVTLFEFGNRSRDCITGQTININGGWPIS